MGLVFAVLLLLACRCGAGLAWDCETNLSFQEETACVPADSVVLVPCPSPPAAAAAADAELYFRLYKSRNIVATYLFKKDAEPIAVVKERLQMHMNNATAADGWARFALTGVTAEDSGLYWCITKAVYPPPVVTNCIASNVHLLLEGHQCKCSAASLLDQLSNFKCFWVWIGAMAALFLVTVLVSTVATVTIGTEVDRKGVISQTSGWLEPPGGLQGWAVAFGPRGRSSDSIHQAVSK
ncbi:unnamed protein product [Merluccius merluccius]